MVSSNLRTLKVTCPKCTAAFSVSEAMAGRSGPCSKCGAKITVPAGTAFGLVDEIEAPAPKTPFFRAPEYVGVECRVCQTIIYGTSDEVGKELKCPDCGAMTKLRPSQPVKKNTPEAMEGEQYELLDDAVLPSDVAAAQPQFVPVVCVRCETRLLATLDQVGALIKCPDCGMRNVVPPAALVRPRPSVLTPDGEGYELDEVIPAKSPQSAVSTQVHQLMFEDEAEAARADMSPKAVKRRARLDARGRAIIPRQPLVTGILSFLFSPGVPAWWVLLTLAYAAVSFLIFDAIGAASYGGLMAFAALISFLLGVIPGLVLSAVAATGWYAMIAESSDGHDEIQNWNTRNFSDWFPNLLYLVNALSSSTLLGVLAGLGIGMLSPTATSPWLPAVLAYGTTVFFLPLVVLSQLDNASAFGVVSGRIFSTLGRCPGSWLLFYLETAMMLGACLAAAVACSLFQLPPFIPMPLYVAAFLLYGRLLGRLGWVLAEKTAVYE